MIEVDDLGVEILCVTVAFDLPLNAPQMAVHYIAEHLHDECGLASSGHTGDRGIDAQRQVHVQIAKVVKADPTQAQPSRRLARSSLRGGIAVEKVPAGDRLVDILQPSNRPAIEDLPTELARAWADVDDPVGAANHIHVVLDHEQRITRSP